jgi:hypothetical protein
LARIYPEYPASTYFLVLAQGLQAHQAHQALRALQALQLLQGPPSLVLAQVLQGLQPLQGLPSPLAEVSLIDYSQSTKKSQETLLLQITPLIFSYTFTSFLLNKTLLASK